MPEFNVVSLQDAANHRDWRKQNNYSWEEMDIAIQTTTAMLRKLNNAETLRHLNDIDTRLQDLITMYKRFTVTLPEARIAWEMVIEHLERERRLLAVKKEMLPSSLAR